MGCVFTEIISQLRHCDCDEFLEIMKVHTDILPPEWEKEYQAHLQKVEQIEAQKRLDDLTKDLNRSLE